MLLAMNNPVRMKATYRIYGIKLFKRNAMFTIAFVVNVESKMFLYLKSKLPHSFQNGEYLDIHLKCATIIIRRLLYLILIFDSN